MLYICGGFCRAFSALRAPEPPFTHKTPPFTQVLFLFDAFYDIISLRKSSSLCSYKTESEAPMKKRILALLLAFSMMLSLLPVSALADTGGGIDFAAYASNGLIGQMPNLRMNSNGKPNFSGIPQDSDAVFQGDGWTYDGTTLTLKSGKYDFNYTFPGFSGSKHYDDCDHLNCVNVNNIVVEDGATIVGGVFEEKSLVNHGTVENGLFSGTDVKNYGTLNCLFKSKPVGIGYHSLTAANNSTVEVLLYSSAVGNEKSFFTDFTFYFTGTPKLTVKLKNSTIHYINGEEHYGDLTSPDGKGYQTFTPQAGEDVVLNRKPYATDLVMTTDGIPDTTGREPIYQNNDSSKEAIGCKGEGWKYENGTLTLESGSYDFSYTYPQNSTGKRHSNHVTCNVIVNEGAAITGGILAGGSLTNSGTVKDVLIMKGQITNTGTLSCLLSTLVAADPSFTRHTVKDVNGEHFVYRANYPSSGRTNLLYFTGTPTLKVRLPSNKEITYINGDEHYGGLSDPDEEGYQTFTPPEAEDIVLNREPYATDLVISGGKPDPTNREPIYDSANNVIGCKGEGWKYDGDTLTLESGSYRFIHEDGDPTSFTTDNIFCNVIVQNGVSVTGGYFIQSLVNYGTIERAAIYHDLENHNTIRNSYISSNADQIKNSGSMGDCLFTHRPSVFKTYSLSEVENYPISTTLNGVSAITVQSEFYFTGTPTLKVQLVKNDDFKKVTYINGKKNYGGLKGDDPYLGYTFTVEKEEDILLNDSVSRDPAPAYTLTVTGGGLVNDKTSAVVEAGKEVRLTVGEGQDGMSFNYWDLPTALTKALIAEDSTFSNKVESLTFTMPDLSEYTEDKSFTIRLDIRPAELPDDDDGPSVLGTMATVAVGGAAAGILVWQGVSLGVDSYLQLSLPDGVPVPASRIELVKLLWETAGKPDVVLPALYGDVSAEDAELQKATRWAIDNGLVKPADDNDASRFDPDRSVSKYEVARAWFKVQQMMK